MAMARDSWVTAAGAPLARCLQRQAGQALLGAGCRGALGKLQHAARQAGRQAGRPRT
jgi:hypothetical protein